MRRPIHRGAALALLLVVVVAGMAVPVTAATGDAEVTVSPTTQRVAPGGTATYAVTVHDIDDGVGSYDINVSLANTSTATITDVEDEIGGTARTEVSPRSARIVAAGGDTVDSGENVVLATVTVVGERPGRAALSVTADSLGDERGTEQYRITGTDGATLEVVDTAPPIGDGDAPPADPNGDGVLEDTNGDGEVTPGDATVLYDAIQRGDPAVVASPGTYDFDGDGQISYADARALFGQALDG